ncbi:MAG: hypothetical protein R2712_13465 [Vicinamibacterales bacterium]
MTRRVFAATVLLAGSSARAAARQPYVPGVFARAPGVPIELAAYAVRTGTGRLALDTGTFDEIPVLGAVDRFLCNLERWTPSVVWLSTRRIFDDAYAERRLVPHTVRPITLVASEVRVVSLEDPDHLRRLVRAVQGGGDDPAYLFITLTSVDSLVREYPVQIVPD